MMSKILFTSLIIITLVSCKSGTRKSPDQNKGETFKQFEIVEAWRTDTSLLTPESVIHDRKRDILYVSDMNLEARKKDGNGFISRLGKDGEILDLHWIDGLSSPKGLAIKGDTLFAADVDEIVVMDIIKRNIIRKIPVEGAKMLNDITSDNEGNLYFSDTDVSKIHKYTNGHISEWMTEGLNGPNGLLSDGDRLLVASQGSMDFAAIDIKTKSRTLLTEGVNRGDGIAFTGIPGYYIVTDWSGEIFMINPDYSKVSMLNTKEQQSNTADVEFIPEMNLLLVPTFSKNCIVAYKLVEKPNIILLPDTTRKAEIISVVNPAIPGKKITVGGDNADIHGFTSEAIQTAVDALRISGGGTVMILPGHYDVIAPVRLYDNIALVGSGIKTVLKKCKGVRSGFALDADYGELQITVADASGFKPGMGVAVYDERQRSGWDLTTAKITSIKDNTIYIDDFLVRDYHADNKGTISNACSVISVVDADNVRISDLVVDGSRESNDAIDGCRAGGIYLHKVYKAVVENIIVKNFNTDGISWQITEYVTVRNCDVSGCANSGLHPGTGSPFTIIESNNSHHNDGYGLFVCWRVRNGIVSKNNFHHNGRNGISTGHKDTDMLYAGNHIYENGSDGIYLRDDGRLNEPHRSIFKNNLIENNGVAKGGYGLSLNCPAEDIVLEDNIIRDTKDGKQQAALFLSAGSLPVDMKNNKISGHPKGDVINEKK